MGEPLPTLFGDRVVMLVLRRNGTVHKAHFSATAHNALEIGKAAEHLVVADLILSGYRAFLTEQGLPYDVVFDRSGKLLRIQVKSTLMPRPVPQRVGASHAYMFSIRRAGKGAKRIIGNEEFDLLALVALDIKVVAYLRMADKVLQTVHLSPPNSGVKHKSRTRLDFDGYTLERALAEIDMEAAQHG